MSEVLLVLAAIALLLIASGLMLWQWASGRQAKRVTGEYLAQQIRGGVARDEPHLDERRSPAASGAAPAAPASATPGMVDPWLDPTAETVAARRAGLGAFSLPGWLLGAVTPQALALAALGILSLTIVAFSYGGGVVAGAVLLVTTLFATFLLWLRVQKAHKTLVGQLPGFIDAMVRLITIGNSTHAAFQLSIASTKAPLRGYLEKASSLVRAGVDLDHALQQMARSTRVEEMHLLASILGLGVRYGGRADLLLERVANFMRDHEQAEEELVALSAETRLSAWVLGLLPIAVSGVIVMTNASYFTRMWEDPTGRMMIFSAMGLQLLGATILYRLARLA